MRSICLIFISATIMTGLIVSHSQSPPPTRQSRQTETQAQTSQTFKPRRVLVRNLPKGLRGIVLQKGVFRLSEGYKFETLPDNSVAVALKSNGEISGTFTCGCYVEAGSGTRPSGSCKAAFDKDNRLMCIKVPEAPCDAICFMEAKVNNFSSRLAIF